MEIKIFARFPLFGNELDKIKGILSEAECVNEALVRAFPDRFLGINATGIHFDDWDAHNFAYTVDFDRGTGLWG